MYHLTKISEVHAQTDSPLVLPHGAFVGLAINLSNGSATVAVKVDSIIDGDFEEAITLEGTSKNRWPNVAGINTLKSTGYIQITWDTGTLQVFQKT